MSTTNDFGDLWEETYRSESPYSEDDKDDFMAYLSLPEVLGDEDLGEDEIYSALEDEEHFKRLAGQYAKEHDDVDPNDVTEVTLKRYLRSKEKGVALGPVSRMSSTAEMLDGLDDIYREVVGEDDQITQEVEKVMAFHSEVTDRYNPEHNDEYDQNTPLDLWRLQHDIVEGGVAFVRGLKDTSETFDAYTKENILPTMIDRIAEHDTDGEYGDRIVNQLEAFIEENIENHIHHYFEENFEERITDIEETVEEHSGDIGDLTGRIETLEGRIQAVEDFEERLDNHSDQFEEVEERLDELGERMEGYDDQLDDLEDSLKDYVDQKIGELESDIDDIQDEVNELDSDVSDNESDISDNKSEINSLDSDVAGLRSAVSALEARMGSAEGRIDDNEDSLSEYKTRLDNIEGDIDVIDSALDLYKTQIDNLDSRVSDLEEDDGETSPDGEDSDGDELGEVSFGIAERLGQAAIELGRLGNLGGNDTRGDDE